MRFTCTPSSLRAAWESRREAFASLRLAQADLDRACQAR